MARPKKKTEQNIATPAAPAPEKKITTKKETAPAKIKSPAKTTPKPAAKTNAKSTVKSPIKDGTFLIQSNGKDYTIEDIKEACKAAYKNGTRKQVKSCDIYLKVENGSLKAYYVINGKADGAFIDL